MKISELARKQKINTSQISFIRADLGLPKGVVLSDEQMKILENGIIEYKKMRKYRTKLITMPELCKKHLIGMDTLHQLKKQLNFEKNVRLTLEHQNKLEEAIINYRQKQLNKKTITMAELSRLIGVNVNTIKSRYSGNPYPKRLTKKMQEEIIEDFKVNPRKAFIVADKQKYIDLYNQMIKEGGLSQAYIKKVTKQPADNIMTTMEKMGLLCYIDYGIAKTSITGKSKVKIVKAFNPVRDEMRKPIECQYNNGYQGYSGRLF